MNGNIYFWNCSGEFGDVYKGTLTLQDGKTMLVAAKTLKVLAHLNIHHTKREIERLRYWKNMHR
jgi:hypothetical protein